MSVTKFNEKYDVLARFVSKKAYFLTDAVLI